MSPTSTFKPLNSCLIIRGGIFYAQRLEFLVFYNHGVSSYSGIVLSIHQIKLSNKQSLFDRRLKAYMLANGLISLCKDNYKWISEEREAEPQLANDYNFKLLTNNTYMESQADAINHPLKQPFHKEFLRKREELRNSAMEVELILEEKLP